MISTVAAIHSTKDEEKAKTATASKKQQSPGEGLWGQLSVNVGQKEK